MEIVMESTADHYRRLGATSLCSGFAVECLVSIEKYHTKKTPSALGSRAPECQKFIEHTIAALKEEAEAPSSIRRVYRELVTKKSINKRQLLAGWQNVLNVVVKIQQDQEPKEIQLNDSIKFLKGTITDFNDISEHLEKKLYGSSWSTRDLI
ncbi:MAG TPA: hypothetical protein VK487_00560 [Candidatus Bathyarchaeia archaeon]|nr:hypothetical protein [Candidatus Bathyarchaeia archaeon]